MFLDLLFSFDEAADSHHLSGVVAVALDDGQVLNTPDLQVPMRSTELRFILREEDYDGDVLHSGVGFASGVADIGELQSVAQIRADNAVLS